MKTFIARWNGQRLKYLQLPDHNGKLAKSSDKHIDIMGLILSCRRPLSYRNQSIDLLCKSMDWFLYDRTLRHERVNYILNYQSYENESLVIGEGENCFVALLPYYIFYYSLPYLHKFLCILVKTTN